MSSRRIIADRPAGANETRKREGFSLVEVLVATFLISGLAASILYTVALAIQANTRSERRWDTSLDLWNRAVQARRPGSVDGEMLRPVKDARPLRRVLVCREGESDPKDCWEVLRGEK